MRSATTPHKVCPRHLPWVLVASLAIGWLAAPIRAMGDEPTPIQKRFAAIDDEYTAKIRANRRAVAEAKSDEERTRLLDERIQLQRQTTGRFLAFARENTGAIEALAALHAAINIGGRSADAREAIEILRRDWLASPQLGFTCKILGTSPHVDLTEPLLRDILKGNPSRTAQGHACLALARMLDGYSQVSQPRDARSAAQIKAILGKGFVDRLINGGAADAAREAESLYQRVVDQYVDVRQITALPPLIEAPTEQTIGPIAQKRLDSIRELAPGKVAPEITGPGLDGNPLKLSDYRGKVVVLNFWATWCGPCMAMVPNERQLVARFEGRPLALLGVNCDFTEDQARAAVAREQMTWPHWFDGRTTEGGIADRYHVDSLPAIFVIDARGVIRHRDVREESLTKAIEALLSEG